MSRHSAKSLGSVFFLFVAILAAVLVTARPVASQVSPGTPLFVAYDSHQYDTINLQNLNIILNVPVISKSGAFPFTYSLQGDSYIAGSWQPGILKTPIGGLVNGVLTSKNGRGTNSLIRAIPTNQLTKPCPPPFTNDETTVLSAFVLQFPDGTTHKLPYTDSLDTFGCINTTFTDQVIDGSGYTATVLSSGYANVVDSSGTANSGTVLSDSNGNAIGLAQSGNWGDTLGLTALTEGTGTYSWSDVNGGTPQVSTTLTSMTLRSAFGCGHNSDYNIASQ
jgi:hypothetical protein